MSLLQRCVAVRQAPVRARSGVLSAGCGLLQQPTWTSVTQIVSLQRPQQLLQSSRYTFCTKPGESDEDEYPPLPAYQADPQPEKKELYIVQVKGLLWSCTAEDLLQFFSECRIRDGVKGIHLTTDRLGRPSGRAFIEMEHEEDVNKALEKHRQYLGPRYVEVFEVTNRDAESILKKAISPPADNRVVWLRGLPFNSTEADIAMFFSGLDIVENGIVIVTDRKGRSTGRAFVQFSSQESTEKALQRNGELIGNRYIEVFPSRKETVQRSSNKSSRPDFLQTSSQPETNPQNGSTLSSDPPLHYVHMRGLPFQVSGEDVVKFFYPLVMSKIVFECSPDGRLNGEADVYFSCHQDAAAAMSRDRQHLGGRYIELFLNSIPQ